MTASWWLFKKSEKQVQTNVNDLGVREYLPMLEAMRDFTDRRAPGTEDEIWVVQHPPVFTLGMAGRREHLLAPGDIPVVQTDRGGQVTYHGPGQVVIYVLCDLRRAGFGVASLVQRLEQSLIDMLAESDVTARRRQEAPGVYVGDAKIAALGLRVRRGCSYHGLALNVDMDLEPFTRINPCGYPGLRVTQLRDLGIDAGCETAATMLLPHLLAQLGAETRLPPRAGTRERMPAAMPAR